MNASPATTAAANSGQPRSQANSHGRIADLRTWIGALRLHQWSKNMLVLVPLVLGHKLDDPVAIMHSALGMLLLGLPPRAPTC